jgi:acyl-CoA reductase-like NAD-dependent aldehyde dehydrogenase
MYKLFINGQFVRSESGRSDPLSDGKDFVANVARGSRKDVRDAVVAARAAQGAWWKTPPATRGLMLYRLAEMLEARRAEFDALRGDADEVTAAIDSTIWYAGWCDKYAALLSTRNPVAGPHFNYSSAEPMGVVAVLVPDEPALLALVASALPPLVAGNAVVLVASETEPRSAMVLAEAVATSDVPPGVVNIITGYRSELGPVLAKHMDVNALVVPADSQSAGLRELAAENVKRTRVIEGAPKQSLDEIAAYCEIKTIWHPAGI